jgi:hemerythrin
MDLEPRSLADNLAQAHRTLLEQMNRLEAGLQSRAPGGLPEVTRRLAGLRADLAAHFRLEEENGYMQAVLARAPQFERKVQQLREEHALLARSLDELVRDATAASDLDPLREAIHAFLARVREHESKENLLVEDAFNLDFCGED